jgi:branched-chain amino acid transport system permease protein
MLYFLQQVLNGLHAGALYALLAFGYTLTHGVLRRTNLAYGAVFAFAGQTAILVAVFGWHVLWLALPATVVFGVGASFLYAWVVGHVLSRTVFEPLAGRSPNTIVAATLGVALVLMEIGRLAAETRDLWLPPMLASPVVFAEASGFKVTLTLIQLINCAIVLATVAAGGIFLARSNWGRAWRAVCDDARAAAMVGVDVSRVFHLAVIGGAMIAALAGALAALYYGNISFGTGLVFGLKILFLTAAGGYESPVKSALGAAAFGLGEALWSGYFGFEWREGWMFAFLVALLVLRPEAELAGAPART